MTGHPLFSPVDPNEARVADPLGRVYTPRSLAAAIVRAIDWPSRSDGSRADDPFAVLDPSAGGGALLGAVQERWPTSKRWAIDIDPDAPSVATTRSGADGFVYARPIEYDTELVADWPTVARFWDRLPIGAEGRCPTVVVMNPPFGRAVGIATTIAHVRAALFCGATRVMCLLPLPLVCSSQFERDVWALRAPAVMWRITTRPWPKKLREAVALEWRFQPGLELTYTTAVERLDWDGDLTAG